MPITNHIVTVIFRQVISFAAFNKMLHFSICQCSNIGSFRQVKLSVFFQKCLSRNSHYIFPPPIRKISPSLGSFSEKAISPPGQQLAPHDTLQSPSSPPGCPQIHPYSLSNRTLWLWETVSETAGRTFYPPDTANPLIFFPCTYLHVPAECTRYCSEPKYSIFSLSML